MIKSLIYLRIEDQQPQTYTVPLLQSLKEQLPGLTTFEFDNFSEETLRQYALELGKQSGMLALVVEAKVAEAPVSGLSTFFNRLMKVKPARLLMVLQGEQPLLQKMMQVIAGEHFHQNLPVQQLEAQLFDFFSGS
jgi:hypothetical protein